MITKKKYRQLRAKIDAYLAWVDTIRGANGWASYQPEDVPATVPRVSDAERSQVEVYEFCANPPDRYLVYVRRIAVAPGVVGKDIEATTWTGQLLGKGRLGIPYKCGKGLGVSRRYPISFKGINGRVYRGTFFASSGDYARVHWVKRDKT